MSEQTEVLHLQSPREQLPVSSPNVTIDKSTDPGSIASARRIQTQLAPWGRPANGRYGNVLPRRNTRVTPEPHSERWLIQVKDTNASDLWVTGDFLNWRLPGLHMSRTAAGVWEVELLLTPGQYEFACYQFIPGGGFRRLIHEKVDYFLLPTPTDSQPTRSAKTA